VSLPYDVALATRELRSSDPAMRKLIDRVGRCRMTMRRPKDPFRALLRSIIYQQLSGASAGAIEKRVLGLFESRRPTADALASLSDASLREAGLSRQKISYCRDLAAFAQRGELPSARALGALDDESVVERLTPVKGIGRWTVQMMLMSNLGRPDVWPVDDFGVRKGYMVCHGLDDMPRPAHLEPLGDPYRPWRSVASWYFWREAEQAGRAE